MFKILAIGNSFSSDATAYLYKIAESAGVECKVVNIAIGGCTLERHYNNIEANEAAYGKAVNGVSDGEKVTVMDTLLEDKWDYVTMQQASGYSGLPQSYFPYISALSEYIKKYAPDAKQVIHQTWAYETTSTHPHFAFYGRSQNVMYPAVVASYEAAAKKLGGLDIIRCGELIQTLRSDPMFDVKEGKYLVTRDGFHMNIPYGRYAIAGLWFKQLMGGDITAASFVPEDADVYVINRIKRYIKEFNR